MMHIRHYRYNKLNRLSCWLSGVERKALIFLCMLAAVLSAAVACNDNSTSISSSTSSSTPFFPVQKAGLSRMEALLEGRLELDNGCLRVKYSDGNYLGNYLLIWPHGFSLHTKGEEIQVIDINGQIVARVGDKITVGGGEIPGEGAKELIEESIVDQPLPDNCTGPYWIVSNVIN